MNTVSLHDIVDPKSAEAKKYSLCRAIASIGSNHNSLEREISNEYAKRLQRNTGGIFVPVNIPFAAGAQRTTSGTAYGATINAGQGGASLVATDLLAASFIDVLRNKARVVQAGAQVLSGLVGNVAIPRQDSPSQPYWLSPEGTDITESEATFDQVTMSPKTVGARAQYTRQLLLQSTPDIEALVRNDLTKTLALAIDAAALSGSGTGGQPTGVLNTPGISTVAIAPNGGASSIDTAIAMETLIMQANTDEENVAYMTNAKVVGGWKSLKDTTGRYLWTSYPGIFGQRSPTPGEMNGYPVFRTNQIPSNLTKGTGINLSAIIMGDWTDLIIGEWGILEILANPFGPGFNSGTIDIRALQSVDIKLRRLTSFCSVVDATQ